MKTIAESEITYIHDGEFLPRQIKESVDFLIRKEYFVPALCVMACAIDALVAKGEKPRYLIALKDNFPELCSELGALVFYEKYRNGSAHLLAPLKGFAISRESEMKGQYAIEIKVKETKKQMTSLNIDRFYRDFNEFISNFCSIKNIKGDDL